MSRRSSQNTTFCILLAKLSLDVLERSIDLSTTYKVLSRVFALHCTFFYFRYNFLDIIPRMCDYSGVEVIRWNTYKNQR